jgi:hypothetical protein
MLTDPVLQQTYASRNLTELIRDGERERLAGCVIPWYRPSVAALTPVRLAVGAVIIRTGRVIQGATAVTVAARPAAKL